MTRPERRTYDQSARLTQRVDGTGVNSFTYNTRDQLATMVDAVTGASRAYNYNDAAQTCLVTYASAAPGANCTRAANQATRSVGYDSYGRTQSDVRQHRQRRNLPG